MCKLGAIVGTCLILLGASRPGRVLGDLVIDGSFQGTGSGGFTGWTVQSAIPGASATLDADAYGVTANSAHVATGSTYAAFFGPTSPTSSYTSPPAPGPYTLSQSFVPTQLEAFVGQTVTFSFELMVEGVSTSSAGLTGFQVDWFGQPLETSNPPEHFPFAALNALDYITPTSAGLTQGVYDAVPYTLSFSETVTQADVAYGGPSIAFSFLDDAGFFYLDDVSVTPSNPPPAVVPEPATKSLAVIGTLLAAAGRWRWRSRRRNAEPATRDAGLTAPSG